MTEYVLSRVKAHMKSQSFHVNDAWLSECIEYCCSPNSRMKEDKIIKFVEEQFLLSNLKEINNINGSLPPNLAEKTVTVLTGKYTLQLLKIYDISVSKFKQLEKIRHVSNINVEATNEKPQSWEPTGKRMLQLFLTDGIQEIVAIEYKSIRVLNESLYPGLKITIIGPVTCRKGVLLLEETNVSIRGGEVDDLLIPNALENVLATALNMALNEDPYDDTSNKKEPKAQNDFADDFNIDLAELEAIERSEEIVPQRQANSTKNSHNSHRISEPKPNNYLPNNRTVTAPKNQNFVQPEISEFPEDDDVLFDDLELEEEYLSNEKNKAPVSKIQEPKVSASSKDYQFPDDDFDLNDVDFSSGLEYNEPVKPKENKSEIVTGNKRSAAQLSPIHTASKIPCQTVSNRKITDFLGNKTKQEEPPPKICEFISDVLKITLTDQPICKTVRAKVTALGKLLKKNKLWILDGTITDQSGQLHVDFSSQFMETILGLSVDEFSQLKKRIKTNPELEEQLRKAMIDGQNKLQEMDCLMSLELKKDTKAVATSFSELTQAEKESHNKRFKMLKAQNKI